jgi:hypothetical protein
MLKVRPSVCAMLGLLAGGCDGSDPAADALKTLEGAESYELLSLDPGKPVGEMHADHFAGHRVLGRLQISDQATRHKLNDALRAGMQEQGVQQPKCFDPRHGIRVTRAGKTTDLVICFACRRVRVSGGQRDLVVSPAPQPAFDEVLRAANVTLPPPAP